MKTPPAILLLLAFLFVLVSGAAGRSGESPGRPVEAILDVARLASPTMIQSGDTLWFGGTTWNAAAQRWEAVPDSMWTFESGVGSHFNHDAAEVDPFKDPSLHAYMEGWVGADLTRPPWPPAVHRVERDDPRWDSTPCVGADAGLGGDASLWIGLFREDACYAGGQGYGDIWYLGAEQAFAYSGGPVVLEFDFKSDTEPGFDYVYVVVDTSATKSKTVWTQSGAAAGHATLNLFPGNGLPSAPGSVTVAFVVASDGAYSDEDGLYPTTCGALAVDNVSLSGGITHVADFESNDDGWVPGPMEPGEGDRSHLAHLDALPPMQVPGPCGVADSVLTFGSPPTNNYYEYNVARSPWIDLAATGSLGPGKVLEFSVYALQHPIGIAYRGYFTRVEAQWYPYVCPHTGQTDVSPWVQYPFLLFWGSGEYCSGADPERVDLSNLIPAGAQQVRLAIGAVFTTILDGPYGDETRRYDNIRFGVYGSPVAVPEEPPQTRLSFGPFAPNPLRAGHTSTASLTLLSPSDVKLDLFDLQGRHVRRLLEGSTPTGVTRISWDGRDGAGRPVAAGLYLYRLTIEGGGTSGRLVVSR